jgi:hypothetical protein
MQMKQMENPSFERVAREALQKARQLGNVAQITEAVNRAAILIAMSPEKAEEVLREKMQEGVKL